MYGFYTDIVDARGTYDCKYPARGRMRVEQLSPYVRDVGVTSFGSIAALDATLYQTRMQRLVTLDGALTLTLASHKGDKSLQHLRREMRGDRYDVRHKVLLDGEGVVVNVGANLGYFTLTVAKGNSTLACAYLQLSQRRPPSFSLC